MRDERRGHGPAAGPSPVAGVARAATGRAVLDASLTARTPITYDPYLRGRSIERVEGTATHARGGASAWSAVVKRTTGPGLREARRELEAYRTGVAAPGGAGLGAPRLLGAVDEPDVVELWLEPLNDAYAGRWPVERFAAAARSIATWDASWVGRAVPDALDSEDAWAERHAQPERVTEALAELQTLAARAGPELIERLADPGLVRTASLISSTAARIRRLSSFPASLLHQDLVRSNLFALPGDRTAAIDWEHVGRGPLGVDLAPFLIGSVRRGEASSDHLAALETACLDSYERELGRSHPAAVLDVRPAYRLAVGLRWHVVLGAVRVSLDPDATRIRGSRPLEARADGLRHLIAVARYILDAADLEPV